MTRDAGRWEMVIEIRNIGEALEVIKHGDAEVWGTFRVWGFSGRTVGDILGINDGCHRGPRQLSSSSFH